MCSITAWTATPGIENFGVHLADHGGIGAHRRGGRLRRRRRRTHRESAAARIAACSAACAGAERARSPPPAARSSPARSERRRLRAAEPACARGSEDQRASKPDGHACTSADAVLRRELLPPQRIHATSVRRQPKRRAQTAAQHRAESAAGRASRVRAGETCAGTNAYVGARVAVPRRRDHAVLPRRPRHLRRQDLRAAQGLRGRVPPAGAAAAPARDLRAPQPHRHHPRGRAVRDRDDPVLAARGRTTRPAWRPCTS